MDARTKEAIRYLGYGRHAVDDHTLKLVESCFEELSQAACGRIVYRIFELEFPESEESFWEIWISTVKIFIKI